MFLVVVDVDVDFLLQKWMMCMFSCSYLRNSIKKLLFRLLVGDGHSTIGMQEKYNIARTISSGDDLVVAESDKFRLCQGR